jgi:hypothetical protein
MCSWLSLSPANSVQVFLAKADKSDVKPFSQPYAMLPKPSFWQANMPTQEASRLVGPKIGLSFTWLYQHSYCHEGPVPWPQLTLPVSVFQDIMQHEGALLDPKDQALADLVIIVSFFLLQVLGKYILPVGDW